MPTERQYQTNGGKPNKMPRYFGLMEAFKLKENTQI